MPPFPTLPTRLAQFVMRELYEALPPPVHADPTSLEDRDVVAMATIRRLCPINTTEARQAVIAVAAQTHVTDCLRLAGLHRDDLKQAAQCRAQAAMMMRTNAAAMRELRALQAARPPFSMEMAERADSVEAATRNGTAAPASGTAGTDASLPDSLTRGSPEPDSSVTEAPVSDPLALDSLAPDSSAPVSLAPAALMPPVLMTEASTPEAQTADLPLSEPCKASVVVADARCAVDPDAAASPEHVESHQETQYSDLRNFETNPGLSAIDTNPATPAPVGTERIIRSDDAPCPIRGWDAQTDEEPPARTVPWMRRGDPAVRPAAAHA